MSVKSPFEKFLAEGPFVIAEMSGNHNGSLKRALEIVDAVAKAGAPSLKLQTYTADTMTIDSRAEGFVVHDKESPWHGETLYALYQRASTPWEWHKPIFERCRERGLIPFSTPFDHTAVDFLESLDAPIYKIASFENTDLRLIRRVAATGKPVIISTGMATLAEIGEAVGAARDAGAADVILLKCTSAYPADPGESNLATISALQEKFGCIVGISDHTLGIGVSVAAVALGARVIEKHVTLRRADGGVDSAFSMEPEELASLVTESRRAAVSVGSPRFGPTEAEKRSIQFRRSLYIVKDMKAGEVISDSHLKAIRPGHGLPTAFYERLVGRKVNRDVARGTPASLDLIK